MIVFYKKKINTIDGRLQLLEKERINQNQILQKAFEDTKTQIALFAAIVTIIFGIFTVSQKRHDRFIAIRNKLTDILEKLSNLNMDNEKYRMSQAEEKNKLPENYTGILSDSRRFFVNHAANYASKLPEKMLASQELNVIAQAFNSIDDYESAKKFFLKAIERAQNAVDEILSKRNFARFIYLREDPKEGEKLFSELFETFKGTSLNDSIRYYLGETYKRWGTLYNSKSEEYKEKLDLARKEFEEIKNTQDRNRRVTQINEMLNGISK